MRWGRQRLRRSSSSPTSPVIASERGGFGETVEPGVSGLLFPNGDEDALAGRMLEIATGRAFGDHVLPDAVVQRLAERHRVERYVRRLREIFQEVAVDP